MDDSEEFLLLNPGPVPVTDAVLESMAEPMVSHRSAAFEAVYERARDGLDAVFERSTASGRSSLPAGDAGTSLLLNGTATMGMEAAVANAVGPDDEVVALVNGKFGRRFARIAERHTDRVRRVEATWGEPLPVSAVREAVTDETAVVAAVHNETSTGLLNPVWAYGAVAREHDALLVVDGVTSIGGDVFRLDWGVDVAITDAQKALAAPPGISAMYATDRATDRFDGEAAPFYEDLDWYRRKSGDHQTPFTSAVPLFRGMATAVEEILAEGLPARIARHHRQARAFRDGFTGMGLEPFPEPRDHTVLSNTLTAVALPEPLVDDADDFFAAVEERNVSISGGQAHLGGRLFRVSNMGNLTREQVVRGVRTVGEAMNAVGVDVDTRAGVRAAEKRLERPARAANRA